MLPNCPQRLTFDPIFNQSWEGVPLPYDLLISFNEVDQAALQVALGRCRTADALILRHSATASRVLWKVARCFTCRH